MLSPQEQNQLKLLVTSPQWGIIQSISEMVIARISQNSSLKDTADETLKETAIKEGKIEGIKQFLQEIFLNAQQNA